MGNVWYNGGVNSERSTAMDFLKTLLIYMTLTFAMTVQEAPAPGKAPEVTPVPESVLAQSIGTATPKPEYTAVPTATPKPADPTRSAPTITPNAKYKTIQYGDRGADVTKLQRRLIELGYMKKGSDDGAYGYQTLNAVRDFQKANGLSVDGAAGRVTLTTLYEDPNVVSKLVDPTETPVPLPQVTAAPTAAPEVAETAAPEATAAPDATQSLALSIAADTASLTDSWQPVENATVLLNGSTLVLLQRTNDIISQRKPTIWLNGDTPMISLNDLIAAAGSWQIQQSSIDQAQFLIAGYQIALTAANDAAAGTAYMATVNGIPCPMNDGTIFFDHNKWYITPAFLLQTTSASVTWDSAEQTLVILLQDASIANSVD